MKNLPRTMRTVDAPQPGGPDALIVCEQAVPEPGPDQVLIRAAAAGVNRADTLQRRGSYPPPPGTVPWPGLEIAGTVAAIGPEVTTVEPGDRVCALLQGGGYAEFAVAPEAQTLRIPAGLDFVQAACLPEACFTVWSNVFEFGRLAPGESLLVHGGSSGIGVTAIQIAAALGNPVYATAGTDAKCRFCETLGAARAVNYKTADFAHELQTLTRKSGVDVILDMIGGSYLRRNVSLLATGGRLVIIATQGGTTGELDVGQLMRRRAWVTGSTLRPRSTQFKAAIKTELERIVWPLVERGKLRAIIDSTFPLERAAEAHARMESGAHIGKIVLTVD